MEIYIKTSAWYGGFWERLTKMIIRKTLGRTLVTLEELQTLIVEIEAILNDNPITLVLSDINNAINPVSLVVWKKNHLTII